MPELARRTVPIGAVAAEHRELPVGLDDPRDVLEAPEAALVGDRAQLLLGDGLLSQRGVVGSPSSSSVRGIPPAIAARGRSGT